MITAIAAISTAGVLGDGTQLPWHLPADLRRFRRHTVGKPVIMGRRTQQSLKGPLPDRINIVLSRTDRPIPGYLLANSPRAAFALAREHPEIMVIGGGEIYRLTAPLWGRLLLTVVAGRFAGAVQFPVAQLDRGWTLNSCEICPADSRNPHHHWFLELEHTASGQFSLSSWLANRAARPIGRALRR